MYVSRGDRDVGARVQRIQKEVDDLDGDGEVGVKERDGVAARRIYARAHSRPLTPVRQSQHLERQAGVPERDLRTVEDIYRGVARSVVGEDDLRRDVAVAKKVNAADEARLDAASLVIGR